MPGRKRSLPDGPEVPYLARIDVQEDRVEDWTAHPFRLPFVRGLSLTFTTPVTFLVGENGSGKTTLLEAIADLCRLPIRGGGRTELASNLATAERSALARALRPSFRARPWDGYFVRAENLGRLADLLEQREQDPDFLGDPYFAYGGRSLHQQSHGEGFIALFEHRLQAGGIFLMDEPEAALSPQRQLALLAQLYAFVAAGQTQLIIATHSPVLMTFPGATLLEIRDGTLARTSLEETRHYQITRGILEAPERYWRHLRGTAE